MRASAWRHRFGGKTHGDSPARQAALGGASDVPDPQDPATSQRSKLDWNAQNKTLLNYYQALIRLRKETPDLQANGREKLNVSVDNDKLILNRGKLQILLDFKNEWMRIKKADELLFNSASAEWGGTHV